MTNHCFVSLKDLSTLITSRLLHEYFECDILKSISDELAWGIVYMYAATQIDGKDMFKDAQVENRRYQTKRGIRARDANENVGITDQSEDETIEPLENGVEGQGEDVESVEYVENKDLKNTFDTNIDVITVFSMEIRNKLAWKSRF